MRVQRPVASGSLQSGLVRGSVKVSHCQRTALSQHGLETYRDEDIRLEQHRANNRTQEEQHDPDPTKPPMSTKSRKQ